jgi:hypothetical protein
MKQTSLTLSLILLSLTMLRADDLPKAESFSRYLPMLKNSPFAVATASAPASAPDFAKDLYVANAAHTSTGDFVTIASTTDHNFKEYLTTSVTVDGYTVPNVQWSDRVGQTKVTIAKDGQVATLGFNEAVLSEELPNEGAPISQPITGPSGSSFRPPVRYPGQIPRPMMIPTIPTPPPHTRGMIRRNRQRVETSQRPLGNPENP